jgi:hypothetical protein
MKIRNPPGDGSRRDSQRVREFHDLDVNVVGEFGRSIMERMQRVDTFHSTQELKQFRLSPHQNLPCDFAERLGEPHELDRVTQPVIAANQHALVDERLAAPDTLEVPLAGVFGRTGSTVFLQIPVADAPGTLQVRPPHRFRPITVHG